MEAEAQLGRTRGAQRAMHRPCIVTGIGRNATWEKLTGLSSNPQCSTGTALLLRWGWGQGSSHAGAHWLVSSDKTPVHICPGCKTSFHTVLLQIPFCMWLFTCVRARTRTHSRQPTLSLCPLRCSVPGPPLHTALTLPWTLLGLTHVWRAF